MDALKITGRITAIGDIQDFASGFRKRSFAVKEDLPEDKYPQTIGMEFVKDKCLVLEQYEIGDLVTVHANLRGSEYNGRHYVNLQAWKIVKDGQEERRTDQGGAKPPKHDPGAYVPVDEDPDEEIPF